MYAHHPTDLGESSSIQEIGCQQEPVFGLESSERLAEWLGTPRAMRTPMLLVEG